MAFSDALRSSQADVVLRAETGQFNADIERAEQHWRNSVGQMSKEALKLDLAQDRLRKSLAQYGAESSQAKRATIALKDAEEQAARAADKQTRETEQLNRATRSANVGFSSLRNRVVGLAAAYIGAYGLVSGIRSAVEAAKEEQIVLGQTRIAVEAAGLAWGRYEDQIQTVIRAQSQLGFDDEALLRTFQMFVRSTRDVSKALELNALAADVARGRYIDLEQAAQIVNKANLGMSGALRRIGLDVEKNATRQELLTALTRNYGRAAEEASGTAIAASDRLAVEWENMQEILGGGLLPAVTNLSNRLSAYLGDAENQRRVQERVNEAVKTGEEVVRGFAGAIRIMSDLLGPFIKFLGGAENAAKLFFLALAVRKFAAITGAITVLRTVIASLGPTSVASAATSVTAMNTIGTAATINAGRVGVLRGALAGLAGLPALGLAGLAVGAYIGITTSEKGRVTEAQYQILVKRALSGKLTMSDLDKMKIALSSSQYSALRSLIQSRGGAAITDAHERSTAGEPAPPARKRPGERPGRRTIADIELDLARAAITATTADDLRYHRELLHRYQRQAAILEARKNLTAKQKETLRTLYGQIASEQAAVDAIIESEEQRAAAKREEAARKREERRRREEAALERQNRAAERYEQQLARRGRGRGGMPMAERQRRMREARRRGERAIAEGQEVSREDMRRQFSQMAYEFLTGLQGTLNTYGGNLFGPGELSVSGVAESHSMIQTDLMRQQVQMTRRLGDAARQPASRYAYRVLTSAFDGYSF